MARRGFLDYVLGGAVGGLEGLAQKRAAEEERKRMADAAAMDQARLLMQLNYRVAPEAYNTEDPAARSILPPLEMPSTVRPSLSPMTMPSTAPRPSAGASGALSAVLNRDFKVDPTKPSLSRGLNVDPLALDSRTTRMTEVLGRGQEARAAQEPIAASVTLPGGQKVRFNAPESAAQIASRTRTESDAKRSQELTQALSGLSALTPEQRAQYEPLVRASLAGVPSNVLQSIITPPATRARRTQLNEKTGQIVDLDTGETVNAKDYIKSLGGDSTKGSTLKEGDAQRKAGTNLMLNANKRMLDFENKVYSGELKITVGEQVLRRLATDFSNEKTPIAKIISSSAYDKLATANPEFTEYMRNIDGFAEGETATVGRPSNYRTQMARFLSGIAAGSPKEVIRRVQERRAGFMAPYVEQFYGGDIEEAERQAVGSVRTPTNPAGNAKDRLRKLGGE